MGSEMGNNNVSGIKEEEKAAVEVPEKAQEDVPADEDKGENNVILEAQSKDFHAKGKDLSSNGLSAANDLDAEKRKSNEKEIGGEESKPHSQSPEASSESKSQDSDFQKSASQDEGNYEKPLELNLEDNISSCDILQTYDQSSIGKETDTQEVEKGDLTDSKTTSQPSKTSYHSARSLEDSQCLTSNQSDEVPKVSETCNLEEKEDAQKDIIREENLDDFVPESSFVVEDELLEVNTCAEKCDTMSRKNKLGEGLQNRSDDQVPLRMNLNESSDSSTEAVLQYSSLDPSVATPEPQEERIIHAEEINLIPSKSDKGENKHDSKEINSLEQTVNELIRHNSAPPVILHDTSSKENGEEVAVQLSCNSDLEKVYHTGKVKVTHKRSKSVSIDQFEDTEEIIKMLPTITSVSTVLSSTDKYVEEERATRKTSLEETEKREDMSSSIATNNSVDRGTTEECISGSKSFKWESNLLATSPSPPFNSQHGNETRLDSEASEDKRKCTIDLQEIFIIATSNLGAQKASMQTPASSSALEIFKGEPAINVQTPSGTSAETEVLSNWSNEQCASGEMSHLPKGKAQESSVRVSIESNPGHPGNQQQRSKSPSFDFGLQLDARSEESDQTPLLHHDKTAARSFSGFANVRFQNRINETDYGRKSLDFEPVAVEEKTIKVERSDSEISRASFMNLLKKDEKPNAQFSPQKQESPVANKKSDELSTEELALTSLKGSGKRKTRPSIFTSCICCTAAIH